MKYKIENSSFQVQYGSSSLPLKFYTGEVDAFWRNDTSFEESRVYYLKEREKQRKALFDKQQKDADVNVSKPTV